MHAALFLIVNFFCLAVFFLILGAPFLFVVQIIVYAGAIMVLFLFVIMLLGVDGREDLRERRLIGAAPARHRCWASGSSWRCSSRSAPAIGFSRYAPAGFDKVNEGGNTQALARVLFHTYFFPFEVTSILLIVAAIAVMVLAQRKARAVTQAEMEAPQRRARAGGRAEAGRVSTPIVVLPGAVRRSCSRSGPSACWSARTRSSSSCPSSSS